VSEADEAARLQLSVAEVAEMRRGLAEELAEERRLRPDIAPPVTIEVNYLDARQACGTMSNTFNAELIRQAVVACARPGEPGFDEKSQFVIAAMQAIAPRNALEGLRASLAVAAHQAAMSAYRVARSCPRELAPVFFSRGDRAAIVADALIDAIERGRGEHAQEIIAPTRRERAGAK
jgi:hypothetical protein